MELESRCPRRSQLRSQGETAACGPRGPATREFKLQAHRSAAPLRREPGVAPGETQSGTARPASSRRKARRLATRAVAGQAGAAESRCASRAQSRERLHGHGDGAGALRPGCRRPARARRDARFCRRSGKRHRAARAGPGGLRSVPRAAHRATAERRPALTLQEPGRPPRRVRLARPPPSDHARAS